MSFIGGTSCFPDVKKGNLASVTISNEHSSVTFLHIYTTAVMVPTR